MANPICPSGCNYALAAVNFDACAPELNNSEIWYIYVAKRNAASFTDWTAPTEWANRLSQNLTSGNNFIRKMTVIADKPAPTLSQRDISGDRTYVIDKTHVINVTVDETNSVNHEFMRQLECGGQVKVWYETKGGLLFGGNDGIDATFVMDQVLNRGRDEIITYNGTITWRSKFTEERTVSPIAGSGSSTPTYDTTLTFASATTDTDQGITGTVSATDADTKFEFLAITPRVGSPMTMNVNVSSTLAIVVDFTSDYLGQPFKFTDASAAVHTGTFINGTVNF